MNNSVEHMASWGATWMVVTGASRGLGSEICEQFAAEMAPGSTIVGVARSETGLQETAKKLEKTNSNVQFVPVAKDLMECDSNDWSTILDDSLRLSSGEFKSVVLMHNAGSIGKLDYLRTIEDYSYVKKYMDLNISSLVPLTTVFLKKSKAMASQPKIHVINISSLCALSATKSWGLYCIGKAGRDMMLKVLAEEEKMVKVLNYAPGCLDTDMQKEARTLTSDPELKSMLLNLKEENKLVQPKDTVARLIRILEHGKYSSGDHVDYYD